MVDSLSDSTLDTFCQDYFPAFYEFRKKVSKIKNCANLFKLNVTNILFDEKKQSFLDQSVEGLQLPPGKTFLQLCANEWSFLKGQMLQKKEKVGPENKYRVAYRNFLRVLPHTYGKLYSQNCRHFFSYFFSLTFFKLLIQKDMEEI